MTIKITIEIDAAEFIERLEDAVPDPTGGKEDEESLTRYANDYLDEIRDAVEDLLMEKLVDYHTH